VQSSPTLNHALKRFSLATIIFLASGFFGWGTPFDRHSLGAAALSLSPLDPRAPLDVYGKLPLYFVENRGQTDNRVAFYIQGSDKTIYFTDEGLTIRLMGNGESGARSGEVGMGWALKLDFIGANRGVRPRGQGQTDAVFSYFKGSRDQWRSGLKTYSSIVYSDLWPGIDLIYEGTNNRLKYTFVVRPGADPNQIRLAYRGAGSVSINHAGNGAGQLVVTTPVGSFNDKPPVSYQEVDGRQVEVATAYRIEGRGSKIEDQGSKIDLPDPPSSNLDPRSSILDPRSSVLFGFELGEYDRSRELVIDPAVLVYAGYIGGSGGDFGIGITVDSAGAAYVTGMVDSSQTSFPVTVGPDLTYAGFNDAFVAKIKADGTGLVYCGYIGGAGTEQGYGVAVDSEGSAHVVGMTSSDQSSFPVTMGPDLTQNGFGDAFVAKIKPDGTGLVYCGYVGGNDGDAATSIALDGAGAAYITGITASFQGFPTLVGPDLSYNSNLDAFVAKVKADGSGLDYCGFIGGANNDQGTGIKVDGAGAAYVVGSTNSNQNTFPVTVGPDLSFNVTQDVFVAKVKADGSGLIFCGYIGGREAEFGNGIALDGAGNAYVAGWTTSNETSFPVIVGPDLTFNGASPAIPDAFVARVKADGAGLDYCGYIGGSDIDQGFSIAIDNLGAVYVTGSTRSTEASFPVVSGPDLTYNGGGDDAFVAKVKADGAGLEYCGYIGGAGVDVGFGIAVDGQGAAYLNGRTSSDQVTSGFPATVGPDLTYNGGGDALVAKIGVTGATVTSVSAASFLGSALASESIAAGYGAALATTTQFAGVIPLPTSLAGTQVKVKDSAGIERLAPLFFVSPRQINYQIPPGTANGPAMVNVTSGDGGVSTGAALIAAVYPGLFTANTDGNGLAAAVALRIKADGSQIFEPMAQFDAAQNRFVAIPIDLGLESDRVFLILFGTGIKFHSGLSAVSARIGGADATVSFAGAQGDFVGLDQVNVNLPRSLIGRGDVDIVLMADGVAANTVRATIK
jgi:uncharacterized protein (TIGR03437 family)